MQLAVEGEKYLGRFIGVSFSEELWKGSEYSESKSMAYWYGGTGFVKDRYRDGKYWFHFKTSSFEERFGEESRYSLEEAIVYYNQRGPYYLSDLKPVVVNGSYPRIVDLSLGVLLDQVRQSKEEIPLVKPVKLNVRDLIRLGICVGNNDKVALQTALIP